MAKNEIIFTDLDLDGCCSYLIYTWFKQVKPKAVTLKVSNIREKLLGWLNYNKIEDYKRPLDFISKYLLIVSIVKFSGVVRIE